MAGIPHFSTSDDIAESSGFDPVSTIFQKSALSSAVIMKLFSITILK